MIRLVVSDLDGTLLPYSEKNVPKRTVELISEITDLGVAFAISSGRTYSELAGIMSEFADKIYFTCCDGALTVKNGKVLYARKIETSDIELFFKSYKEKMSFILHGAFENYSFGNLPVAAGSFNCKPIGGIYEIKDRIFKITSFGCKVDLPAYCSLRMHWEDDGTDTVQYANRYCNKGTALSDLHTRLMLTKYDTAVLGDRGNDICMFKGAKMSFCIGDRCKELAEICTDKYGSAPEALESLLCELKK